MVKPFVSLLIILFLLGGLSLAAIFNTWQTERRVRLWERMRLSGYTCIYAGREKEARPFFEKAQEMARGLGASSYYYGRTLVDLALVKTFYNEITPAKAMLEQAVQIFEADRKSNLRLQDQLAGDEVQAYCQLAKLSMATRSPVAVALAYTDKGLALLDENKKTRQDALIARQLVSSFIAIGDYAQDMGKSDIAIKAYNTAAKLSAELTALGDLNKSISKKIKRAAGEPEQETAGEILARAMKFMSKHSRDIDKAYDLLIAARERSLETKDTTDLTKIRFQLAIIEAGRDNYAACEKECLEILKDQSITDELHEKILDRLFHIYRAIGNPKFIEKVLVEQIKVRSKIFGDDSPQVAERQALLAMTYEQMKQPEKAREAVLAAAKFYEPGETKQYRKNSKDPEWLAGVFARNGERAGARSLLEFDVRNFVNGETSRRGVISCYDLAGLDALEGKDKKEWQSLMNEARQRTGELDPRERILVVDALRDWAVLLTPKPEGEEFVRQALLISPMPDTFRDAIRVQSQMEQLKALQSTYPKAFTGEAKATMTRVLAAAKKYSLPKLTGP